MHNYVKVKWLLAKFYFTKHKSEINRETAMYQGYSVGETRRYVKICNAHQVFYFPRFDRCKADEFWNLYRITSIVGTADYVTHSVR